MQGSLRKSTEIQCNLRGSREIQENPRNFKGIQRNSKSSRVAHRSLRKSKEIQDNLRGPSRCDSCMLRDEPAVLMPPETYSNKQFLRLHPLTPIRHCGVYVSNFQTMIFCSRKCGRINSLVEREVRPAFVKFCILVRGPTCRGLARLFSVQCCRRGLARHAEDQPGMFLLIN